MRLWVTRAEPGAGATAAALRALGHDPLVAPLLEVEPARDARLELGGVAALAFTSANGVRAFAALSARRDLPAYAVGEATAAAARGAGLQVVCVGAGDAAALAEVVAGAVAAGPRPRGLVLHPTAEAPAADLAALLQARGVAARAVAVYRTRAAPSLPGAVEAALAAGALDGVLLHSPRAARTLADLLAAAAGNLQAAARRLQAFGLSPACLTPLAGFAFSRIAAADRLDEVALLDLPGRP